MGNRIKLESQTQGEFDQGLQLLIRGSAPADADAGDLRVYALADGLHFVDDVGGETGPFTDGHTAIEVILDGGGSVIATGVKGDVEMPFNGVITANRLFADQSGSVVIDLWKDVYANFPPTIADTITASAKPTLSAAVKSQDTTLTGWTTTFTKGDILRVNVDSATTVTRVTLSLTTIRT